MNNKDILNLTLGQIFAALAAGMNEGGNTPSDTCTPVAETTVVTPVKEAKAKAKKAEVKKEEPVAEGDDLCLEETPATEATEITVAPEGDDDDLLGELGEAEKPKPITVDALRAQAVVAIKKDGANKAKISAILKKVGVEAITNVPPARFEAVMKAFKTLSE